MEALKVDPPCIIPLVHAVRNVFETMLDLPLDVGEPLFGQHGEDVCDLVAYAGLSGELEGTVALRFSAAAAGPIVTAFTGRDLGPGQAGFKDALAELANMVAGGVRDWLGEANVSIAPPLVRGRSRAVLANGGAEAVRIPCCAGAGVFMVDAVIHRPAGACAA